MTIPKLRGTVNAITARIIWECYVDGSRFYHTKLAYGQLTPDDFHRILLEQHELTSAGRERTLVACDACGNGTCRAWGGRRFGERRLCLACGIPLWLSDPWVPDDRRGAPSEQPVIIGTEPEIEEEW